jgi:hypothetical protein
LAFGIHSGLVLLKQFRGFPKILAPPAFVTVSRAKREVSVGLKTTGVPSAIWSKSARKRSFLIEIFEGLV